MFVRPFSPVSQIQQVHPEFVQFAVQSLREQSVRLDRAVVVASSRHWILLRGGVFETYLTHRIADHFLFKADYIRYNYTWSGSGWHIGAPKRLDSNPILGFPGYDRADMVTLGLTAEF